MPDETNIHTEGGASVSRDVNTGNDFVGRDKNIIQNIIVLGQYLHFAQFEELLPNTTTTASFSSIAAAFDQELGNRMQGDLSEALAFAAEILADILPLLAPKKSLVPVNYTGIMADIVS